MLKNYLKIACRHLLKNKIFSLINMMGLAAGMAACLLILEYVNFELSYDDFHKNADRIYRVSYKYQDQANAYETAVNVPALGPAMEQEFSEVEGFARLYPFASYQFACALQYDGVEPAITFNEPNLFYADSSFLNLFSFPLVQGNPETALLRPNSVVIAASTARKYFGDTDPIGKTLTLHSSTEYGDYTVTGVMEDVPQNSHFTIDVLLSLNSPRKKAATDSWTDDIVYTYLLLTPQANSEEIAAKFPAFLAKHLGHAEAEITMNLQPLQAIYLHSKLQEEMKPGGKAQVITLLTSVALIILIIAWINYINLTTARAMERAKEVGVRKVSGANRWQLVKQFLAESLLINSLSILLTFTFVQLASPFFYQLTGMPQLDNLWETNRAVFSWLPIAMFFVAGIFISGLYPAWLLSSFQPVKVLKGKLSGEKRGIIFRKALVTIQFAISIGLIAGVFALYQQYNFMQKQDLGIDINQTIVIKTPSNTDSLYLNRLAGFKEKLQQYSWIDHITTSSEVPGKIVNWTFEVRRTHNAPPKILPVQVIGTDFIETYGLQLLAGRNFFPSEQPDVRFGNKTESVILNEEAVRQLGYAHPENAIGHTIYADGNACIIVGVVNNFHQSALKNSIPPFIFLVNDKDSIYYSVKFRAATNQTVAQSQQDKLSILRTEWSTFFPDNPFDYFYLESFYQQQYQTDIQFGKIFTLFSVLAIFIACLGLFGLSSYTVVQRTKEIGIRKVLGASVNSIVSLLSKDFIKLMLLACVVALPLAWIGISAWLKNYAFRIEMSGWLLLLPVMLLALIVGITVSFQTMKAALANPVKSLKYE